jgi:hypothetical protein
VGPLPMLRAIRRAPTPGPSLEGEGRTAKRPIHSGLCPLWISSKNSLDRLVRQAQPLLVETGNLALKSGQSPDFTAKSRLSHGILKPLVPPHRHERSRLLGPGGRVVDGVPEWMPTECHEQRCSSSASGRRGPKPFAEWSTARTTLTAIRLASAPSPHGLSRESVFHRASLARRKGAVPQGQAPQGMNP